LDNYKEKPKKKQVLNISEHVSEQLIECLNVHMSKATDNLSSIKIKLDKQKALIAQLETPGVPQIQYSNSDLELVEIDSNSSI